MFPAREHAQHSVRFQPHRQEEMLPAQIRGLPVRALAQSQAALGLGGWASWEAGICRSAQHASFRHRFGIASTKLAPVEAQNLAKGITIPAQV